MKRSRFSEEQIIAVLREQEAGISIADACRNYGISSATFYAWKAKFGGMDSVGLADNPVNHLPVERGEAFEGARGRERQAEAAASA